MAMTIRFIILVLMALLASGVTGDVSTSSVHQLQNPVNISSWDVLESIANITISHLHNIGDLSDRDVQSQWLWQIYNLSSRSDIEILNDALTHKAYVDGKISTAAFMLFGPIRAESTIRAVRAPERVADDLQCVESTVQLFQKYCCSMFGNGFMYRKALANMCHYLVDKAAIEDAFMAVCAVPRSKLFDIDLRSPLLDHVSPTTVSGSSEYCERVSVSAVSRMELGRFAKAFRVLMVPQQKWEWFDKLQICMHGDASLRFCECEKDDWIFLGKERWSFLMSPYEEQIIDIKFSQKISGSVSMSIEEVLQPWRYVFLVVGFASLFVAPTIEKYMLSTYVDDESADSVKCLMHVIGVTFIGVTFIFPSSIDTPYAFAAVVCCLASYYVTTIITMMSQTWHVSFLKTARDKETHFSKASRIKTEMLFQSEISDEQTQVFEC